MHLLWVSLFAAASALAAAQSTAPSTAPVPAVWLMQDSGTTAGLRGIDSVDGIVAWASGTGGTVLRTIDGGAHWLKCAVPDGDKEGASLDFRGVQAWDAKTAIVMASGAGEKSRLYKTTDGCQTWVLVFKNPDAREGFFDCFWLSPQYNDGMLLGDPVKDKFSIFETEDGGRTWKRDIRLGLRVKGKSLAAFAASNGLFPQRRTGYMRGFVTGGQAGAFLFNRWATIDWIKSEIPVASGAESAGAFSLGYRFTRPRCTDCENPSNYFLVAVGGDYTKPMEGAATAAWSTDLGQHWAAAAKPPHGYRSTVQWSDTLKAWITAGTNGSDISRDDGKTWAPLDNGNWNALSLPFLVGPNGRIAELNAAAF